ncbi:hypothetical protein [Sphingomonas sp.]|jgi:hypothetical protein|uniref:hypothetical protein n=1 Tax=Sphingomonas sp. TaxID=28214 RepID=UPI002ED8D80A
MKLILLAATAMLAVPAIAQTAPATGAADMQSSTPAAPQAGTPTTADPAQTGDAATMPAPAAAAPETAPAPTTDGGAGMTTQAQTMPAPATGGAEGATPMGGYQPSGAPMTGTATPGVAPTFQAAASPSEAYPAPAPLAKYPVCKKGQYDKCIQRGGK